MGIPLYNEIGNAMGSTRFIVTTRSKVTFALIALVLSACGTPADEPVGRERLDEPNFWSTGDKTPCTPGNPSHVIRVASWNILKKRLVTRRTLGAYDDLLRIIRDDLRPDLLFVQEVTQNGDEIERIHQDLGADYNLLISIPTGQEKLAVIYNKNVLEVEPAPSSGSNVLRDVALRTPPRPASRNGMLRQPMMVYAKVIGPSLTSKQTFDALFLNVHTRPEASNQELDKLRSNYRAVVREMAREATQLAQQGQMPTGKQGEEDIIIVGDVNAAPSQAAMRQYMSEVFPTLRMGAHTGRVTTQVGTLHRSGKLADQFLLGAPTIEDFVQTEVHSFDTASGAHSPAVDVSDHRPVIATFCKYNDTDR